MWCMFSSPRNGEQDLFNILGAMYLFVQFTGISNCSSVLPFIAMERTIMYRERFAGMYSSWAYSLAQVDKFSLLYHSHREINRYWEFKLDIWPLQCIVASDWDPVHTSRSAAVRGHHISLGGVLLVVPEGVLVLLHHVLHSALLQLLRDDARIADSKLPSGLGFRKFLVHHDEPILGLHHTWSGKSHPLHPKTIPLPWTKEAALDFKYLNSYMLPFQEIPKWWVWCYWICPTAWSLKGLLTSQYGDITKEITINGEHTTIGGYLESYYGYNYDELGAVSAVLMVIPLVFAVIFTLAIAKLNFQRRWGSAHWLITCLCIANILRWVRF